MPLRSSTRLALALLPLLLGLGCSRCSHHAPKVAEGPAAAALVPAKSLGVVRVPHLLTLAQHANTLTELKIAGIAASLAGLGNAQALVASVRAQLGFDPTTAEGLNAAGIAPQGLLLVSALDAHRNTLAVVELSDPGRFAGTLARLAKDRLRAPDPIKVGEVTSFAPAHQKALLAYAVREGRWAIVGTGPDAVASVQASLALPLAQSLSASPAYPVFLAASAKADLAAYFPQQPGLARIIATATLAPHQLIVTADVALDTAQATALATLHGSAGAELLGKLDPDAFLVARTGVDPATLWPLVEAFVPRRLRQKLLDMGIGAEGVLANLQPGAAMSLSVAGNAELSRMPSFDPRETNPFRYLFLAGLGGVKDPAKTRATLASLQKFGSAIGVSLESHALAEVPVYTVKYALGEGASLALEGQRLAVSGGDGRMPLLLARVGGPGAGYAIPPAIAAPLGSSGLAAYLDVTQAVKSLRALPESAYGLGGFAIKAAVGRWLDAVEQIHGILLTADTRTDAQGATLSVRVTADLP